MIRNARDCLGVPDEQAREGETPAELTAEEARDLADDLGLELYRAQDALAFVEECCVIAEREQRPITVADVREWLKGARCGRQIFAEQSARTITNNSATSADADWTQLEARAFNAVGSAVRQAGEWLPLSARRAVANAVLGAAREQIDIADEEAWCKSCRRVWDGPHHRCESDAEQRLDRIRDALAGFNDRGVWRIGHVNFDIPTAGEVIDAVRTALDQPPAAATQATHTEEQQ
ncbi:MAG: hypothetical protein HOY75_43435 [Streptomyces sp.]|nr:hypothetical protein [Streptomyces sp.]